MQCSENNAEGNEIKLDGFTMDHGPFTMDHHHGSSPRTLILIEIFTVIFFFMLLWSGHRICLSLLRLVWIFTFHCVLLIVHLGCKHLTVLLYSCFYCENRVGSYMKTPSCQNRQVLLIKTKHLEKHQARVPENANSRDSKSICYQLRFVQ